SRSVTVEHPSAAWADALATAGCVMSWEAFSRLADELKAATAHVYELKKNAAPDSRSDVSEK
ncbi:MAG: thiamine biosynthesis lipoprotein ApbE, partial [Verrucomicrobiales bacterium]